MLACQGRDAGSESVAVEEEDASMDPLKSTPAALPTDPRPVSAVDRVGSSFGERVPGCLFL